MGTAESINSLYAADSIDVTECINVTLKYVIGKIALILYENNFCYIKF